MMLYLLTGLILVLGSKAETDCSSRPDCHLRYSPSEESLAAHRESGKILPSNGFFQENCGNMILSLKCNIDYSEACDRSLSDVMDFDAFLAYTEEFCNETSDLRKAYVEHVDCLNGINISAVECTREISRTLWKVSHEHYSAALSRGINPACIELHAIRGCTVATVNEYCGENAEQAMIDVLEKAKVLFRCREEHTEFLSLLLQKLAAEEEEEEETDQP